MRKSKKDNAVTLIALVVTIVVLLILAGVTINIVVGNNGIIKKAKFATGAYKNSTSTEREYLENVSQQITDISEGNTYSEEKNVNIPKLKMGMTPVKFDDNGNIIKTTESDKDWYDYNNKKWANAQTEDGSLWVWIPRYAYKITSLYHEASSNAGNIEIRFLKGTSNQYVENGVIKKAQTSRKNSDNFTDFVVHPVFQNESSINYVNGGWDSEIPGFWVSKFEAGYANKLSNGTLKDENNKNSALIKSSTQKYTSSQANIPAVEDQNNSAGWRDARNWLDGIYGSTSTYIKYPTFQGNTYSMNYISVSDSYNICKNLTEVGNIYGLSTNDTDSHLMKNSEWGAISYLGNSKYGLNGTKILINSYNKNNEIQSVYAVTGYNNNNQEWNNGGEGASCTGNIYGVYDLAGGLCDTTSSYITNGIDYLKTYGGSFTYNGNTLITNSTKYATIYNSIETSSTDKNTVAIANYNLNTGMYGDAVYETSNSGINSTCWNNGFSHFLINSSEFFGRGGDFMDVSGADLFHFSRLGGYPGYNNGFRACLV